MDGAVDSSELQAQLSAALEALRGAEERAAAGQVALDLLRAAATPLEALGYLVFLAGESAEHPEKAREYIGLAEEQLTKLSGIFSRSFRLA